MGFDEDLAWGRGIGILVERREDRALLDFLEHGLVQILMTIDEQTRPLYLIKSCLNMLPLYHELREVPQIYTPLLLQKLIFALCMH